MNVAIVTKQGKVIYTPNGKTSDFLKEDVDILLVEEVSKVAVIFRDNEFVFEPTTSVKDEDKLELPLLLLDAKSNDFVLFSNTGICSHSAEADKFLHIIYNIEVLYIEKAKWITNKQFISMITSIPDTKPIKPKTLSGKKYIHATGKGTVLVEDIKIKGGPLVLKGRYHFIPVNAIGEDVLNDSINFEVLQNIGKVEIVDEEYYLANKGKPLDNKPIDTTIRVGSVKDFDDAFKDPNAINL